MSQSLIVGLKAWLRHIGRTPLVSCKIHARAARNCSEISLIQATYKDSKNQEFVLRRITSDLWLRREGDLVHREATALRLARKVGLPTPSPIACDAIGRWTGCPALLMSRIQGLPWTEKRIMTRTALSQLARALRTLHEFDYGVELNQLPRYKPHHWRTAEIETPPIWAQSLKTWRCAAALTNAWDDYTGFVGRECLLHRDYRPGNTLWFGGALSGIVDWITACRGNPAADVGHCRWNLCRAYSLEAAKVFSCLYGRFHYDPIWDILAAVGGYPDTPPRDAAEAARIDHFVAKAVQFRSA
jgi:aminoglycoside phosphotransferase (APT) family kinase protein